MSPMTSADWAKLDMDRDKMKGGRAAATADDGVILVSAADLTPEPVSWLWRDWLALGKLHILAGAPGQGKTTLALDFAATVTSGGNWPDGSCCSRGNVLIWSGEDDPADTLLPRLVAMGADRHRVWFVTGTRVDGETLSFDPAHHMPDLLAQAARIGDIRLLIVDPVVSAVANDSHKATEVRRALQPVVDLGAALNAAVLGISHFSKGSAGRDPTERVVGSMAFGAVARVVMCAAKVRGAGGHEGDDARRLLLRTKSNIGPDGGGFEYEIEQAELQAWPGVQASQIAWGQAVEGSARELLAEAEGDSGECATGARDADDSLRQILKGTERVESRAALDCMKREGFTDKQIRTARERIGVRVERSGSGAATRSFWKLPQSCPVMPTHAQPLNGHDRAELGMTDLAGSDVEVF